MKKTPLLAGSAIGLTLAFYMAAYYLLPGDPPTAAMVGLFAALALGIVWACNTLWSKKAASNSKSRAPVVRSITFWAGLGLISLIPRTNGLVAQTGPASTVPIINCFASPPRVVSGGSTAILTVAVSPVYRPLRYSYTATAGQFSGNAPTPNLSTMGVPPEAITVTCNVADDLGQTASTTTMVWVTALASPPPASEAPPPVVGGSSPPPQGDRGVRPLPSRGSGTSSPVGGASPTQTGGNGHPALDRVTGTAVLLAGQRELLGYGLYSYALLFHPPSAAELPRYEAFLKALVDLPTARGLARYVAPGRINLTSIPLTMTTPAWEGNVADAKVAFILNHYDYARSAAIRASLPTRLGAGPVLLSVLAPIDPAVQPSPVLVQDLSLAQSTLMSAYVQTFVTQAAQQRFWQENALSQFRLGLRNSLETAAAGLNLSQTAVEGWIKFFK